MKKTNGIVLVVALTGLSFAQVYANCMSGCCGCGKDESVAAPVAAVKPQEQSAPVAPAAVQATSTTPVVQEPQAVPATVPATAEVAQTLPVAQQAPVSEQAVTQESDASTVAQNEVNEEEFTMTPEEEAKALQDLATLLSENDDDDDVDGGPLEDVDSVEA